VHPLRDASLFGQSDMVANPGVHVFRPRVPICALLQERLERVLVSPRPATTPLMRPASFAVLRALADGSVRPAAALGISRSALRDAMLDLRAQGVKIAAVRGKGYRLVEGVDLISREDVTARLAERGVAVTLSVLDQCGSTNAELLACAASGAPSGSALACELQTAGRGRRGNRWVSGLATSLTFSLLWRYARGGTDLAGLSLAAGVACVHALAALGCEGVRLKWPNDLMHEGRKLGGILVEGSGEARGPSAVVIGVGINVRSSHALNLPLARPITELAAIRPDPSPRGALLGELLAQLAAALETFGERGFAAFRAEWTRLHAQQDARIRVALPGGAAAEGVAVGVDDDGALLLRTEAGVRKLHSGEVSIGAAA
jgi:BirA family transcriptional regulator, biotin operon repressor / biotin---[acetyl-CoA-carboxylase] ligase